MATDNESRKIIDYRKTIFKMLKARTYTAKANAKATKIKEQSEEIKEKNSNIIENFRVRFRLV